MPKANNRIKELKGTGLPIRPFSTQPLPMNLHKTDPIIRRQQQSGTCRPSQAIELSQFHTRSPKPNEAACSPLSCKWEPTFLVHQYNRPADITEKVTESFLSHQQSHNFQTDPSPQYSEFYQQARIAGAAASVQCDSVAILIMHPPVDFFCSKNTSGSAFGIQSTVGGIWKPRYPPTLQFCFVSLPPLAIYNES